MATGGPSEDDRHEILRETLSSEQWRVKPELPNLLINHIEKLVDPSQVLGIFNRYYSDNYYIRSYQNSLLFKAVQYQHYALVRQLLELNYPLNKSNLRDGDKTPLQMAVKMRDTEMTMLLLKYSGKAGHNAAMANWDQNEATAIALKDDNVALIQVFINYYQPKIHPKNYSLLHMASEYGAEKCLRWLIEEVHLDVNVLDADGIPPLMEAVKHGSSLVSLFLRHGASVTTPHSDYRKNYLRHALAVVCYPTPPDLFPEDIVAKMRMLIDAGCDVNSPDPEFHTRLTIVSLQISNIFHLGIGSIYSNCPGNFPRSKRLHYRIVMETVKLLLDSGASPNDDNSAMFSRLLTDLQNQIPACNLDFYQSYAQSEKSLEYFLDLSHSFLKLLFEYGLDVKSTKFLIEQLLLKLKDVSSEVQQMQHLSYNEKCFSRSVNGIRRLFELFLRHGFKYENHSNLFPLLYFKPEIYINFLELSLTHLNQASVWRIMSDLKQEIAREHLNLETKDDLLQVLAELSVKLLRLNSICRQTVLFILGPSAFQKIDELPLPQQMIHYLGSL